MAKITDTIELIDGVSPTMMKIANSADVVVNKFHGVESSANSMAAGAEQAAGRLAGIKNYFAGSLLANAAEKALGTIKESIGGAIALADHVAGTNARLLMVAGSQDNVVALNNMIFESAQRARGEYTQMADTIASLSVNAKDAFPDPKQTVGFVEGLQKLFVIGGTSADSQKNALIQLQQALASGRLMGEDFRSITESAPILNDMIAKTMGITRGELKDISSTGAITADIIKRAILDNMDEINERFAKMPKTWSGLMTDLRNTAMRAFTPVIQYISKMANSAGVQRAVAGIKSAITSLAPVAYTVLNVFSRGVDMVTSAFNSMSNFIQAHTFAIQVILIAAATALGIMGAQALYAASGSIAAGVAAGLHGAAETVATAETFAYIAATEGLTAAFTALNGTMYASPIFWIPAVIVLIIGALYLGVAAFNHFAGTSVSATGIVFAAFMWVFTGIRNILVFFVNMAIAVANFFGSVWGDPLDAVYNLFSEIWNGVADLVASAVNEIIDMINKIPGLDKIKPGGFGHVDYSLQVRQISGRVANQWDYSSQASAAQWGYNQGANLGGFSMPSIPNPQYQAPDLSGLNDKAGQIGKNTGKGADGSQRAADALESAQDDLKYLREIAEREAVNKYTTASVTIEMGGVTNNVSNDMDLDGVVDVLTEGLLTNMAAGARKVHA